jgi:hypothetical protein
MLAVAFSVSGVSVFPLVKVARANFVPAADIFVTSPTNSTYNYGLLVLNYTAYFTLTNEELVVYSIDGGDNVTILDRQSSEFYETICKQVQLPELPDGSHHLVVYAIYPERSGVPSFADVYFAIDTTPPTIWNVSVENRTYDSTNVTLNFNLNEAASQISYNLDNQANVTLAGNSTLTSLTEGSHMLIVYAKDEVGNTATFGPVKFTVRLSKPTSDADITLDVVPLAAVSVVIVVFIAAAAAIYMRKRRSLTDRVTETG